MKTPVKFQKDRSKTEGGVPLTRYLLKTRNHAPRITKAEYYVPSLFFEKAGNKKVEKEKKHLRSVKSTCISSETCEVSKGSV